MASPVNEIDRLKKALKTAEKNLDASVKARIAKLTEEEVKDLVINDKWLKLLERDLAAILDETTQRLTSRVRELADRYAVSLADLNQKLAEQEAKVKEHLQRMGFAW